jgi:hypothetical protein
LPSTREYELLIKCANYVAYRDAKRVDTGAALVAAVVTWSLHVTEDDARDNAAAIASGPMNSEGGGRYGGIIPDTVALVLGEQYWLRIRLAEGGAVDTRILACVAYYHDDL